MALLSAGSAAPLTATAQASPAYGQTTSQAGAAVPGLHDFDFLVGHWQVHHRKLKHRLANNHEWIEFECTLFPQPLMGSYSNVDDTVLNVPGAPIAVSLCGPSTRKPSSGQSG